MLTATKTTQLYGIVNEFGYQILDRITDDILYEAGNNPMDSSPTQSVTAKMGAGIETLTDWANQTGQEMAIELGAKWFSTCIGQFK